MTAILRARAEAPRDPAPPPLTRGDCFVVPFFRWLLASRSSVRLQLQLQLGFFPINFTFTFEVRKKSMFLVEPSVVCTGNATYWRSRCNNMDIETERQPRSPANARLPSPPSARARKIAVRFYLTTIPYSKTPRPCHRWVAY